MPGRRYLVRCLERQTVTADSAVLANALRQAEFSDVADMARPSEDFFFSRREEDRLRRAGGDPLTEAGEWTRFMGQGGAEEVKADAGELERAAAGVLAVLVPPLAAAAAKGGRRAAAALKVLSRIRITASLDAIQGAAAQDGLAPAAAAALSNFGGPEAAARALALAKARQGTPDHPGVVYALRGLAFPETFQYLASLAAVEPLQAHVAAALEGYADFDHGPVLQRVLGSKDPWTIVQSIETMGRLGGRQLAQQIGALFQRIEHPLVRVACLQAVAETGAREGGEVAMAGLSEKNPLVKAAAVEALVTLPVPKKDFRDRVLELLDDPNPKLAMNAALACVVLDPRRAVKRVRELLNSGSAAHLIQGVHCLAYMEDRASAGILNAIIRKAPAGPLRIQGVRSLGRRASRDPQAVPVLASLAGAQDPTVRMTAGWFLASCHPAARKAASAVLAKALDGETEEVARAVFCEALGLAGPAAVDAAPMLGNCLSLAGPVARSAAWALSTAFPETQPAAHMVHAAAVGVRSRACLRGWYQGGGGLEQLAALLGSASEEEFFDAADVARSVAETSVLVGSGASRMAALGAKLAAVAQAEGGADGGAPLLARGRLASAAAVQNLAREPEIKPQMMSQGGAILPTENEAEEALAAVPTTQEAEEAVEAASYYQPEPAARPAPAPTPVATRMASAEALGVGTGSGVDPAATVQRSAPGAGAGRMGLVWQSLKLILFFGLAIFLGRLCRVLIDSWRG